MIASSLEKQQTSQSIYNLVLDGTWHLKGLDPQTGKTLALEANVPGHVHPELLREGLIIDPFWRDQADQCQWVEKWIWTYERDFELDEAMLGQGWAQLTFEGLDTYATVWLNEVKLGTASNMFIEHAFEVTQHLKSGCNHLKIEFMPDAMIHADKDFSQFFACFSNDRIYSRRMQCSYGWDWAHRLVGAGVWRPVHLDFFRVARLEDVFVQTDAIEEDHALVSIQVQTERRHDGPVILNTTITNSEGQGVWNQQQLIETDTTQYSVRLDQAQLWYPNGYGAQPLYTLEVSLEQDGGRLDQRQVRFGVRTVEIEEIADSKGKSFTMVVNGQRIFVKGSNWVPADPFPGTITTAHYERLIELAQRSHMNLLRSWGGGIYEPQAFWEACDRTGVMVSQDFLLACASYPEDDPVFMEQLRVEFEQAIRRLRNHPSLAFWCGDNELGMNSPPQEEYSGKKIAQEISGPLCARLDPQRPFRPTSPFGGDINNSRMEGDCHLSAWYDTDFIRSDMTDYRQRIAKLNGRFLSECAAMGSPSKATLLKFMSLEDLDDPQRKILEYHTKDNPHNGIDDISHLRIIEKTAQTLFGEPADASGRIAHLEYVHYEWVRLTTESLRRKKFDCSGVQYWMYNDIWPAFGWSHVDYWGFPKAAYYADLQANKPVIATIEEHEGNWRVWVCNDLPRPVQGVLELSLHGWSGPAAWSRKIQFQTAANASQVVCELTPTDLDGQFGPQVIMVGQIHGDFGSHRCWLYPGLPRQMELPRVTLSVKHDRGEQQGTLWIGCEQFARVVTLHADLDFSDNYFDLLPGETRQITWSSPAGAYRGPITLDCWNHDGKTIVL